MNTWTNEHRLAFDDLCKSPVMQAALVELERRCQVTPVTLPQGHDALVLAAGQYHRSIGHREVLNHIEEMRKEKKEPKHLPPPNTAEALGLKPTQPTV